MCHLLGAVPLLCRGSGRDSGIQQEGNAGPQGWVRKRQDWTLDTFS